MVFLCKCTKDRDPKSENNKALYKLLMKEFSFRSLCMNKERETQVGEGRERSGQNLDYSFVCLSMLLIYLRKHLRGLQHIWL